MAAKKPQIKEQSESFNIVFRGGVWNGQHWTLTGKIGSITAYVGEPRSPKMIMASAWLGVARRYKELSYIDSGEVENGEHVFIPQTGE